MKIFNEKIGFFELFLLCLLVLVFYYFTIVISTDIPLHAQFIKDYAYGNKPFQVNFLYYFIVYFGSFFSSKTSALLVVSAYVLVVAAFAKYYIVKRIIHTQFSGNIKNIDQLSSIASFLLLFSFSIPSIMVAKDFYYLFSYTPNVWHNSTTIFAMPFVLLLFWYSLKQLDDFKTKRLITIGILIILNVIVKPSFLFVYLAMYPLLLLKKYRFSKLFWVNLMPIVFALLLIAVEYYFIYIGNTTPGNSSVAVIFFSFINTWDAQGNVGRIIIILLASIITSYLFPIVVLIKNRSLFKETMVQFAIGSVIIGLIISNVLTETGDRASDGNFMWQNYMCSFLLFFVCAYQLIRLRASNPAGWRPYRLEIAVLALHFLATILYFSKTISTGSYF